MPKDDSFRAAVDTVALSDDDRYDASVEGESGYVPSAFRRRRSGRGRSHIPEGDRGDMASSLLFPDEPWDAEVWDRGSGRQRRRSPRGFGAVALLGLALGAAVLYAQRFEPDLVAELVRAVTGSGATVATVPAEQAEPAPDATAALDDPAEAAAPTDPVETGVTDDVSGGYGEAAGAGDRLGGRAADPSAVAAVGGPTETVASRDPDPAAPVERRASPAVQAPVGPAPAASSGSVPSPAPVTIPDARSTGAPPPAEPAAPPGTLSIQSYPWGAVYIDGEFVGNSPFLDRSVPAGTREVRVERPGYETYVGLVTVDPGENVLLAGIVLTGAGR